MLTAEPAAPDQVVLPGDDIAALLADPAALAASARFVRPVPDAPVGWPDAGNVGRSHAAADRVVRSGQPAPWRARLPLAPSP